MARKREPQRQWSRDRKERCEVLKHVLMEPQNKIDLRYAAWLHGWHDGPRPRIPDDMPYAYTELIWLPYFY